MKRSRLVTLATGLAALLWLAPPAPAQDANLPLIHMPGSQPGSIDIRQDDLGGCLSCHAATAPNVDPYVELYPAHTWPGSMMAQAARDPIFWACLTVALQDSHHAVGGFEAGDICLRCHSPTAWLGGRSDSDGSYNGSEFGAEDFDGVSCAFCHRVYDPFYEATHDGTREGGDWSGYWDEATALSQTAADATLVMDKVFAGALILFKKDAGGLDVPFYLSDRPRYAAYVENGSGQYFVDTTPRPAGSPAPPMRGSFADALDLAAAGGHGIVYSRYHKSKFFCSSCHDVSNPVLMNLGLDAGLPDTTGGQALGTEQYPAHRFFHVERTFSEFMLSDYGRQGGAATSQAFAQQTGVSHASRCQSCHMKGVTARGCNQWDPADPGNLTGNAPLRPDQSAEHPNSGMPLHDQTGGNIWISYILATTASSGGNPEFDGVNRDILDKGPNVLTLDLGEGQGIPGASWQQILDGVERAKAQLRSAASIESAVYDPTTGNLNLNVVNQTGHKLISGFLEGRRMFLNVRAYKNDVLVYEVNPYDASVGTFKKLAGSLDPASEEHQDALVYECKPGSTITGEDETFHFVLGTHIAKDNRIPPKGFDPAAALERKSTPMQGGVPAPALYTDSEYQGGYDHVRLALPAGADRVEATLYYQGTSREYVQFLRDQINGTGTTLPADAYIIQNPAHDATFGALKAWGDTIWEMWSYNHGFEVASHPGATREPVPGIAPFAMTQATAAVSASTPTVTVPFTSLLLD